MSVKNFITFISLICCFNFGNANFNEEYSKQMVNFAAASFISPQTTNDKDLAKQCFDKSYPDGKFEVLTQYNINPCAGHYSDDCQLVIAKSEPMKMIVIAFRGTVGKSQMDNEASDSLQDYIDWGVDPNMGKVNKYFYNAAETTWPTYVNTTLTRYSGYQIAFTGHSLGGAIASLTALKARRQGLVDADKMTLYTFGEPRISDHNLAQNFRNWIPESYRVIHNSDLVPHMPLCDGVVSDSCKNNDAKPYHQPQEIWYNNDNLKMNDGDYKICNANDGEDKDCSNSISKAVFFANFVSDRGADMHLHYYEHKLDEYGPKGCNSAASIGLSFIALTFLFIFNLIKH